jgi:SAM-dependent methyltransferase
MTYRADTVAALLARMDIAGARVIEIGGDARGETAGLLLAAGAREVVVTNVGHGVTDASPAPGILLRRADARALHEHFPPGAFDAAIGIAVAEHIPDPAAWTASLSRVLRPGAPAVVHGGPIWSGPGGHHCWAKVDGIQYRFSDATNPIQPWEHLLHDAASLTDVLVRDRGLPVNHAEAIVEFVYRGRNINRIPYSGLLRGMDGAGMRLAEALPIIRRHPDAALLARLAERAFGPDERYEVSGAVFVLRAA